MLAACFIAGVVLPWTAWMLFRKKRLPVAVMVDAAGPRPADVARYLAEIAARLDAQPECMRVVFDAPAGVLLDMEPDGRMAVHVPGRRTYRFDLRRRWIADHPVPLDLGNGRLSGLRLIFRARRRHVLYIDPVDANRFRVSDRLPFALPVACYVVLSLTAVVAVILMSVELLAAVLGATAWCAAMGSRTKDSIHADATQMTNPMPPTRNTCGRSNGNGA